MEKRNFTSVICSICGSNFMIAPCGYEHCSNPECEYSYEKDREHCLEDHR
jgi:hypothetical protein